jgi:DNA polymerase elongation subunit (family B)
LQNCEQCGGKRWFSHVDSKTGLQRKHHIRTVDGYEYDLRVWKCFRCGNIQSEVAPFIPLEYRTIANILYLDIEVSKSLVFNYGLRVPSTYINPEDLYKEFYIISWAASYVGKDTVWSDCVTTKEAKKWDDKRILSQLHDLMESADILAGHNLDKFDLRKLNARFLLNGIEPVTSKRTLDTLKIARSKFAFESNRLDYISQKLGLRPKDDIRNSDWLKVVTTGDEKTLKKILKYNKGDVKNGKGVLEQLMKFSGKKANYGAIALDGAPFWLKAKASE